MRQSPTVSRILSLILLTLSIFLIRHQTTVAAAGERISEADAVSRALNNLTETDEGYALKHPRHRVEFTREGIGVRSRRGGIEWRWQLVSIEVGDERLDRIGIGEAMPKQSAAMQIDYQRGAIIERYLTKGKTIEQQFVIPVPLGIVGRDLVIGGEVECDGALSETEEGWEWRTVGAVARLGRVKVIDAAGAELPARMEVTATGTRIKVDGGALGGARYPVTIDPEIGANDFRISDMGPDGTTSFSAFEAAVAYNSMNNEYLVVWYGDDNTGSLVDGEFEIFGQRLNAVTGAEVGAKDFRISDMGPDGDVNFLAFNAAVTWNSTNNEYLVVWWGDDNTGSLVDNEAEIFGQRLNAATGAEVGTNDFRISDMGPDGTANFGAFNSAVAYNSTNNEYLVVWEGEDNTGLLVDNEIEIFGQRLNAATGAEIGINDFRISDMGPDGSTSFGAIIPAVAYNSTNNEYLVVWWGNDNTGSLVDEEFEIYGQRLNAATGAEVGTNDFRISDLGPDGDANFNAFTPAVAYNSTNNEYLVVWRGDDNTLPLVDNEFEIFGQRLNAATGAEVGTNDFRISDMGPDGNTSFGAINPAVAYNSTNNQYLVVWDGDDNTGTLVNDETEIFGQLLTATGAETGANDFRISDMGPDGDVNFLAFNAAVTWNSTNNEYLVVWWGEDNTAPLVDGEIEIFGQRLNAATGAEVGTNDFRISDLGPDGDAAYDAFNPAVAYNSTNNQYLVVWEGDTDTAPLVEEEYEIFGQRIDAATGAEVGTNDFRISDMGPNGDSTYGGFIPAVAYNSTNNEYLVVWYGEDNTGTLVNDETEIFGQLLTATGAETGANDFRISDMGPDGDVNFLAFNAAVTWNSTNNEYLVVWWGEDNIMPLVDGEFEIFGQRLTATGTETGANDFRISDMGPDGSFNFGGFIPAVAYNSTNNEYLVVWYGEDDTSPLVDDEFEIFGQRINAATGAETGANDFRISDMSSNGDAAFDAFNAAVAYNSTNNEYLVVWEGDDNTGTLVNDENEIFGQRLNAANGAEVGTNDFRISDIGPEGNANFDAVNPAVAWNSTNNEYLVVWEGDDSTGSLVDNENEIYGQRINAATGAEVGTNDFRISDMGPDGNANFDAFAAAVAFSSTTGEFLAIWQGSDYTIGEFEIWGQRIDGDGNRPPTLFLPGPLAAAVGVPFTATAFASDPDVPAQMLTFSLLGAPVGMTVHPMTGVISWTPTTAQTGNHMFTLRVTDNGTTAITTSLQMSINVTALRTATALRIVEVTPMAGLGTTLVTAQLSTFASSGGLANQTVTFTPGNVSGTTGSGGIVTVTLTTSGGGPHVVTATFAGDAAFDRSFARTSFSQVEGGGCAFALLKTSESFAANGGSDSVIVSTSQGDCPWVAGSNNALVATIASGTPGNGTGPLGYNVLANANQTSRSGTLNIAGLTFTVAQGANFLDVPTNDVFYTFIGKLSARGVTTGCGGGNYCPNDTVTREQMAAFIMRALGEFTPPTPGMQRFIDVPPVNFFYNFIDRLAVVGVTTGCNAPTFTQYCPANQVNREQMAAFLMRALGEFTPPAPPNQRFLDVPPANFFNAFIEQLAVRRITVGCNAPTFTNYCPGDAVTRGQMAAFLVRAFGL